MAISRGYYPGLKRRRSLLVPGRQSNQGLVPFPTPPWQIKSSRIPGGNF